MKKLKIIFATLTLVLSYGFSFAQEPKLHVNPRWKECSFQLDPSLTQSAWHQFTREAGLVTYFRPLTDAKPMGAKKFELAILKWETGIDDNDDAWNNTFVHIDSTHYLFEGPRLAFPGLTFRMGVTDKMDVGLYFTKSIGANYGFYGGQIQYNLINDVDKKRSVSARANFTSIFGPQDFKFSVYGIDLIASKEFPLYLNWLSVAPYVGVSTYLSSSHETSDLVNLKNENIAGGQAVVGAVVKAKAVRLGAEYNFAKVNSLSFKIGVSF
jgi:hypothetical protein